MSARMEAQCPESHRRSPARGSLAESCERHWATKHETNPSWLIGYWESRNAAYRDRLLNRLSYLKPYPKSLLELGCNCGPNLARIAEAYPDMTLGGIDVNEQAIQAARRHLPSQAAALEVRSIYKLWAFPNRSWDVVLTCATLIHIPPTDIEQVLSEALRIARRAVVMVELHARAHALARPGKWAYDYWELLRSKVPESQIDISELPPTMAWDTYAGDGKSYRTLNAIIVARSDLA